MRVWILRRLAELFGFPVAVITTVSNQITENHPVIAVTLAISQKAFEAAITKSAETLKGRDAER